MTTGMLWLDDDRQRPFEEKVNRAVAYFRDKYGRQALLCYVNKQVVGEECTVGQVRVLPAGNIMPGCFLVSAEG